MASRLSREFQDAHPQIACADIVGFRNLAVHAYFSVSWPIVGVMATEDVPILGEKVAAILANEYAPE